MIKRLVPVLVLIVAASVAGALLFLQRLPSPSSHPPASAGWLPAETVIYLQLWNVTGSLQKLRETDVYALWSESAFQKFASRWVDGSPRSERVRKAVTRIEGMKIREAFVGVTKLTAPIPEFVLGFEAEGGPQEIARILEGPTSELRKLLPSGEVDVTQSESGGFVFDAFTAGQVKLFTCQVKNWFFLASEQKLLTTVVDRQRRSSVKGSLLVSRPFKDAVGPLPQGRESLAYIHAQPLVKDLLTLLELQGAEISEADANELRTLKSFAATTSIDKGGFRDAMFFATVENNPVDDKLKRNTLVAGTADTLFYMAAKLPRPAKEDQGPAPEIDPATLGPLREAYDALMGAGISLQDVGDSFGREMALGLDWTSGGMPTGYVIAETGDAAKLDELLKVLGSNLPGSSLKGSVQEPQGATFLFPASSGALPMLSVRPALRTQGKFLVIGTGNLEPLLQRIGEPSDRDRAKQEKTQQLADVERFRVAASAAGDADDVFGYVDLGRVFTQASKALRPALGLISALAPQVGATVDLAALPPNDLYEKHLKPTTFAQSNRRDGVLFQSSGSITLPQVMSGIVLAAGAAAWPQIEEMIQSGNLPDLDSAGFPFPTQ
jgi:hypothetical protein